MAQLRFSLRTAVLLTTLVAMAITIALFWWEIGPLRAEVRRLRLETGQLTIDDPTKIYAIAVTSPPAVGHAWKWRVYLPPGKQYCLHTQLGTIAESGTENISGSRNSSVLESGEHVFEITAAKDGAGEWQTHDSLKRLDEHGGLRSGITCAMSVGSHHVWLDGKKGWSCSGVTEQVSREFDPGNRVELLRLRAGTSTPTYSGAAGSSSNSAANSSGSDGAADGILIWIDDKL